MYALLTACGRNDLLQVTLASLADKEKLPIEAIFIHEDEKRKWRDFEIRKAHKPLIRCHPEARLFVTEGMGQHRSIEEFVKQISRKYKDQPAEKYYLHLEDDWEFNNAYDWVTASQMIMETDDKIIKVLVRNGSEHPCVHTHKLVDGVSYGFLFPWLNEGITWHGFSWNPGVTRLDLLAKFMPFPKYEQELAERIYAAGYKVVEMTPKVYRHIGEGRNTTHADPGKK